MTPGDDSKPTVRVMVDADGTEYKVAIGSRLIFIRPKGSRSASAEVCVPVGSLYKRLLMLRALDAKPHRAMRAVKRGLL